MISTKLWNWNIAYNPVSGKRFDKNGNGGGVDDCGDGNNGVVSDDEHCMTFFSSDVDSTYFKVLPVDLCLVKSPINQISFH